MRVFRKVVDQVLSVTQGNTSGLVNRGGISDLTLLRTLETTSTKCLGDYKLFYFISVSKIGSYIVGRGFSTPPVL